MSRSTRVIIWTVLVVLAYTMLITKFLGHRSIGSREDFLRFLPYMGMAAILVMWPRTFEHFFFPKGPGGCIWNLVTIGRIVSKKFGIVDGRTDDGACLYYKLPGAFGSGKLKTPTRTFCKRNRPLPYYHPNCRTPRHWKFTQGHHTTRPPLYGRKLILPWERNSNTKTARVVFLVCNISSW